METSDVTGELYALSEMTSLNILESDYVDGFGCVNLAAEDPLNNVWLAPLRVAPWDGKSEPVLALTEHMKTSWRGMRI